CQLLHGARASALSRLRPRIIDDMPVGLRLRLSRVSRYAIRVDNVMQSIEAGALYFALVFAEHGAPVKERGRARAPGRRALAAARTLRVRQASRFGGLCGVVSRNHALRRCTNGHPDTSKRC